MLGGYVAGLVVWAVAAFAGLGLNAGRAAVLFAYLAASSFVARLVVIGVNGHDRKLTDLTISVTCRRIPWLRPT